MYYPFNLSQPDYQVPLMYNHPTLRDTKFQGFLPPSGLHKAASWYAMVGWFREVQQQRNNQCRIPVKTRQYIEKHVFMVRNI